MHNSVLGELFFNTGWKTKTDIELFDNDYNVDIKAKAYYEKDGITAEQETAFSDFNSNKKQRLKRVEKLLTNYANVEIVDRFVPRTILFERNGSYAILFDDKEDIDNGVVVCIFPIERVITQDEYL